LYKKSLSASQQQCYTGAGGLFLLKSRDHGFSPQIPNTPPIYHINIITVIITWLVGSFNDTQTFFGRHFISALALHSLANISKRGENTSSPCSIFLYVPTLLLLLQLAAITSMRFGCFIGLLRSDNFVWIANSVEDRSCTRSHSIKRGNWVAEWGGNSLCHGLDRLLSHT
jgi:hypothetical protein